MLLVLGPGEIHSEVHLEESRMSATQFLHTTQWNAASQMEPHSMNR